MNDGRFGRRIRTLLMVTAVCGIPRAATAQPRPADTKAVDVIPIQREGTIISVTPESVVFRADAKQYIADLKRVFRDGGIQRAIDTPPARIVFDWDEKPTPLLRDRYVRFEVQLRSGRGASEVRELTVINRVPTPVFGRTRVFDLSEEERTEKEESSSGGNRPTGTFDVTGRVVRLVRSSLSVDFPQSDEGERIRPLQVTLADEVIVKLEDITFARRGDQVKVDGEVAEGEPDDRFWATAIHVSRAGKSPSPRAASAEPSGAVSPSAAKPKGESKKNAGEGAATEYRGTILKIN